LFHKRFFFETTQRPRCHRSRIFHEKIQRRHRRLWLGRRAHIAAINAPSLARSRLFTLHAGRTRRTERQTLNAAYQHLLEPKERLRHLLELERGTKPEEARKISAGTMNLFMEVSSH